MIRFGFAAVVVCCGVLLAGCGGTPDDQGPRPEVYDEPARTVRPDERAYPAQTRTSGEIEFRVLGVTTGITAVAGSHIEIPSVHGQDVRVRIAVRNTGRTNFYLHIGEQRLATADGRTHPPDTETMRLKRQPLDEVEIGANVRVEFDLWWDIDAAAVPRTVKLLGTSPYSVNDPPTADFPLP
ncbi:DUF4352 domain-containing protein [Actinocorallia lasiicapitis]